MTGNDNSTTQSAAPAAVAPRGLAWYLQREWLRLAVLVICGFAARFPALYGELIWDDQYLARGNPFIKSPILALEAFRHHLIIDAFSTHYRPVQTLSYMVDYFFWNTNLYGFHLSNVLWHVGSGVLLYFLLRRLVPTIAARAFSGSNANRDAGLLAFLLALAWVLHPVHSAAVDYVSGRADSLAFFFAAGSWLLFLRGCDAVKRSARAALFTLAAVAAFLALCSRESAAIWLLLFLIYLFTCHRGLRLGAKFAVLAACLCLVAGYAGLRQLPTDRSAPTAAGAGSPAAVRATLMLRALGDYGRLMVAPWNLHMERTVEDPRSNISHEGWRKSVAAEYLSVGGLLVAAALIAGATRRGRAQRLRAAGAAWFILAYLPISNLIDLNATVAEHWLYLPSVGFLLFVAGCCLELPTTARKYATAVACLAIAAFGARSFVRSTDWVNGETFYRRTFAAGGASVRVALNLGQIYSARGEYAKAETLFRKVLELTPDYPIAQTNLGSALVKQGKLKEAEAVYAASHKASTEARKEYPRTWLAALNLAHLRKDEHDLPGAISILDAARREYSGTWELISYESELLRELQGPAAALPIVQDFIRDHWWHLDAAVALGKLYSEQGNVAEAERAFRHASRLDVYSVEGLNLLALLDVRQNHLDSAFATQRRALARQPDQPRQYLLLADILQRMGRDAEAQAALSQVTRLQGVAQAKALPN